MAERSTAVQVTMVVEIVGLVVWAIAMVLRLMHKLDMDQFMVALWIALALMLGSSLTRWRLNRAARRAPET
jgi:cation transport ATPase